MTAYWETGLQKTARWSREPWPWLRYASKPAADRLLTCGSSERGLVRPDQKEMLRAVSAQLARPGTAACVPTWYTEPILALVLEHPAMIMMTDLQRGPAPARGAVGDRSEDDNRRPFTGSVPGRLGEPLPSTLGS